MKYIFLALFFVLLTMSAVAWVLKPPPLVNGRSAIVWASDDNPSRRGQISLFNQLHPNLDLELDATNHDLDKVITQSLSGVGPDVFDAYGEKRPLLNEAGLLCDVTDQLQLRGITLNQIWPMGQAAMSINGRIFGVPCNIVADAMWYHKDIFDGEHIPYPPAGNWNWPDFLATARRLTRRDSTGRITRFAVMGMTWQDVMFTNRGRIFTPDGRRCIVDSTQCITAMQNWADLQFKYHVMPTPIDETSLATSGGWNSGVLTLFQEKRLAMAAGGRWWLSQLRNVRDENGNFPFHLGVCEKPVLQIRRFRGWARVAFVNALSPHRDQAVEFLVHLMSNEYSDAINRQADGLPASIAGTNRPAYNDDPFDDSANSPIWKALAQYAISWELSPYISFDDANNILEKQTDEVRAGKDPAAALHQAAALINAEIAANVARDPALRQRFNNGDHSVVFGNFSDTAVIP